MKLNSITTKLMALIIIAFLITYVCILFVADRLLTEVIDKNQNEVYAEKLDLICNTLSRADARLQMTGLVEAYSKNFKESAITNLKETYYNEKSSSVYPFIISQNNKLLMHPLLEGDDSSLQDLSAMDKSFSADSGNFICILSGEKRWCIYKKFVPWGWTVGYTVPFDIKYVNAKKLRNILIVTMSVATAIMLIILAFVITKLTKPILKLTRVSTEIAKGNLEEKIDLNAGDEVGTLSRSLDIMRSAIKRQINDLSTEVFERKEAEDNLRVTLNSIGDAVIATDIKGKITRMNPVAERLCGYSLDEAKGKLLKEVFNIINAFTREPQKNPIEKVLMTGRMTELANHTILVNKNFSESRIADSASPIKNDSGNIIGVVIVFRDITKEYHLQEQLRQIHKMDAIGQLAGGIAHDFNNMLGGIIGASELLDACPPGDPKCKQYNDMILETADRATELVKKLLAFARKQQVGSSEIDVHNSLKGAISILQNTIDRRIKIEYELRAEESVIIGDMSQLQGIFLNLGINSSHSMPEGGIINIHTNVIELDSMYCESGSFDINPGKYIEIEFRDSGSGIPAKDLQHIFEPFFTTKSEGKGTGLGLAVAYGTVQQHQGAINVYSEVGVGTVFHILLPLISKSSENVSLLSAQPISGCGRILVIDDELVMRKTASTILSNLGYSVVSAENGKDGLETFIMNNAEFDLVLLDMIMPVMNGRDCFRELKKIDSGVRVILASGFTRDEDVESMKKLGLCGYINKPYKSVELSKIVHSVLSN